ncbi:MAG TPA: hypothetical protein VF540_11965, partial [Segetibacter sp.]
MNKTLLILTVCLSTIVATAQEDELKIPDQIKLFVEKNMKAIMLEKGDLNGDGEKDYILVLEKATVKPEDQYTDESERPTLILVHGIEGKLFVAARNNLIVRCKNCGGAYGDPFDGIKVRRNSFTVSNTMGSRERSSESFQFNYSSRDKTWQLVRAVQIDYDSFKPKSRKTKVL